MKNGSTWKVISCAAVLLFGLVTFILGGWRTDMANAATDQRALGESVELQGNRITALETRYETIDKALDRIEKALKEH